MDKNQLGHEVVKQGVIKVSGNCVPSITSKYMLDGTIEGFYLWNPIKLGYVTYYAAKNLVEGKIQGRLKATGIRPKFVEKFEVMGIHLPPGLFGFNF